MAKKKNYFRQILLDSWTSYRAESGWTLTCSDLLLAGGKMPYWSIGFDTLIGGKQDGVDVLEIDNGSFCFTVVPTRGMGIYEAYYENIRLGWDSPVTELVNPALVNLEGRSGLGWLDGFNEWLVRCGLASNGAPCEKYPLHGRIANTPASSVSVSIELESPYTIKIHGTVHEVSMYHENFLLETEISTTPGANWIQVSDRVTNLSSQPDEMQMLYHVNYGPPLLEEGSRFVAPVDWLCPRDSYSEARMRGWNRYRKPGSSLTEEVMFMGLKPDRKGQLSTMLRNATGDLGVVSTCNARQLPYMTVWKQEGALADGYVTGLEPGTNLPNNRVFEGKNRRVVKLGAGKSWQSDLTLKVLQGKKNINAEEKSIRAVQGRRKPEISDKPLKKYAPL